MNALGQVWVKCVKPYWIGRLQTMWVDEYYLVHHSTADRLEREGFVENEERKLLH